MCSPSGSAPPKGLGGQITSKSDILFQKLLVINCRVECTENDMGASGVCVDVELYTAGRFCPVRGAQVSSPYFGIGHLSVLFFRTIRPIRIKFDMRHQGNQALSCCAPLPDPHLQRNWGTILTSKYGIFFKNLFVRHCEAECTEIIMRLLEHVSC